VIGKHILILGSIGAFGVAGCGGSGASSGGSLKLGAATSLSREGNSGSATAKAFKYKTAIISVRQAGPNALKGETVLGDTPKNDIAFYVTQRVTGVQASYSDWIPESPDVYDSSGSQATPLETGTDLRECVETSHPAASGRARALRRVTCTCCHRAATSARSFWLRRDQVKTT
jgi:hypothetical protein